MNILLLGSGGREDALAWRLRQSPSCDKLLAAPGNPGIARWAECISIDPCDPAAVTQLAREADIDLVVVGPEAPLVAGVADPLRAAGFAVFGPNAAAAQLEGSKGFIHEKDGRIGREGPGDADTLLLAAAQLVGIGGTVLSGRKAQLFHQGSDSLGDPVPLPPQQPRDDADVLFKSDTLRRALSYAESERADHVVLFPRVAR